MSYYFTGDEHFAHNNILKYCNRPFPTIEDNDEAIIERNNKVVKPSDTVIHAGDFTLIPRYDIVYDKYIRKLNGNHIFLRGSHDRWMNGSYHEIWERTISGQHIVVCHYAMFVWSRSHYGSWQLYGHSHGGLSNTPQCNLGKQWDVGVDNNNFYPVSFDQIVEIMKTRPENFNILRKE